MKYIYGPIKSRRLGLSLGLSLTPYKACSFDCIYCQLGETTISTAKRKEYINEKEILDELRLWFKQNRKLSRDLNFVTFSGFGEPTLNIKIGSIISAIKKIYKVKVAVITNSFLLNDPAARRLLLKADLIVPSLDAVTQGIFQKVDRPIKGIRVENIIHGLAALRREYKGKIWLEVMLIKGINDSLGHISLLKKAIARINPDKVQLNSPVRKTAEWGVLPVGKVRLKKIQKLLGENCEIF